MEETTTAHTVQTLPKASLVMAILFLLFFLGTSDNQMISPLLPLIARDFGLEAGQVGGQMLPTYALAAAFAALFVGPLSDKFGRRKFLLFAAVLFGLSLLATIIIKSPVTLALVRLLTGLAAGTISTCSIAYVGDFFPYERRGVAMSVVQAGYFGALVIGVPLATVIAQSQGWRFSFAVFGIVAFLAFISVLVYLPEDKHFITRHVVEESRRFANIKLAFHTRERIASILAAFCVSCGFVGFLAFLGSWLAKRFTLQPRQVGLVFIAVGIISLIGAFVAGPFADKFGKRSVSLLSTLLLASMLFVIPQFDLGVLLFVTFSIAALAFAFRQGPLQALATELVPAQARGALVAMRNTASQIGIAVSTSASGLLYDRYGYHAVGIFCGVVTLAAAVFILMMGEPHQKSNESGNP
ncbi:MAG: MFS transporter [Acidobacteriota bacterium]